MYYRNSSVFRKILFSNRDIFSLLLNSLGPALHNNTVVWAALLSYTGFPLDPRGIYQKCLQIRWVIIIAMEIWYFLSEFFSFQVQNIFLQFLESGWQAYFKGEEDTAEILCGKSVNHWACCFWHSIWLRGFCFLWNCCYLPSPVLTHWAVMSAALNKNDPEFQTGKESSIWKKGQLAIKKPQTLQNNTPC